MENETKNTENLITLEEAARFLKVRKAYMYKLTYLKKIPYYRPNNGKVYFKVSDLWEYLERYRVPSLEELEEKAKKYAGSRITPF